MAGLALLALACAGVAVVLLSDRGAGPAPLDDRTLTTAGSRAATHWAVRPTPVLPVAALCRRRALGPGDLEGEARRDFAPRCIQAARASSGAVGASR